jgi:leucyl/phenylalanyl-tRNA---protein transferase
MIPWLDPYNDSEPFPDVESALTEPDGLLAAGGSLRPERLLLAYHCGIFPWYNKGEPILWWCPSRRAVIFPDAIHVSRSLHKALRKQPFVITHNKAYREVMLGCAEPRKGKSGTWITAEMLSAYHKLFQLGYGRSIECWYNGRLAGGIYGVQLGHVFFGESMFSRVTNASKVALVELSRQKNVALIDCQLPNDHLASLGMVTIPRQEFLDLLQRHCAIRQISAATIL